MLFECRSELFDAWVSFLLVLASLYAVQGGTAELELKMSPGAPTWEKLAFSKRHDLFSAVRKEKKSKVAQMALPMQGPAQFPRPNGGDMLSRRRTFALSPPRCK